MTAVRKHLARSDRSLATRIARDLANSASRCARCPAPTHPCDLCACALCPDCCLHICRPRWIESEASYDSRCGNCGTR